MMQLDSEYDEFYYENDWVKPSMPYYHIIGDTTMTSSQYANGTSNDTAEMETWRDDWLRVTLATVSVTVIIVTIVLGNGLVVVAIAADRQLKGVQNWFIASLAVSDLLVGLFIMPLSLVNELMGYWVFGDVLCQLWLSTDVLLCTASILNLCLISLDRYWSITRAISYLRKRTPTRSALMISVVWITSAIICFPPLAGWSRPQPVVNNRHLCLLSEEPGYVLYSIVGSFYLPMIVMAVVYVKIYLAARWRARRHLKGAGQRRQGCIKLKPATDVVTTGRRALKLMTATKSEPVASTVEFGATKSINVQTIGARQDVIAADKDGEAIIVVTHVSDGPATSAGPADDVSPAESPRRRIYDVEVSMDGVACVEQDSGNGGESEAPCSEFDYTSAASSSPVQLPTPSPVHKPSVDEQKQLLTSASAANNYRTVTTCTNNSGPAGVDRLAVGKVLFPRHRRLSRHRRTDGGVPEEGETEVERSKRRMARARERRATLVLGVVMAAFVGCWLPFFSVYPISLLAGLQVPEPVFGFIFWLGYCNSALNPIIYTVFNRDFRRAFQKLLSCSRVDRNKVRRL